MKLIRFFIKIRLLLVTFAAMSFLNAGDTDSFDIESSVEAALPEIQEYSTKAMNQIGIPGLAVVVVYQDEIVLLKTAGTRKSGEDWPITEDTIFQFASLSKPMTSSVVAAAVDRKAVAFTDPVAMHDVPLQLSDSWLTKHVTLADLLSHRSGLPGHAGDYLEDLGFSVDAILKRVGQLEPEYPFRDGYAYTNFGFTAAGLAAANATGMTFAELAQETVFEPLGMANSSFLFTDYQNSEKKAHLHYRGADNSFQPLFVRDPDQQAPAGGLSTSILDYSRWMRMQLNEGSYEGDEIISPESLTETWRPHAQSKYDPETFRAGYYGLGWGVGRDPVLGLKLSHSGAFTLGTRTAVYLFPEADLGIAVATNSGSNGVPEAIALAFEDLVSKGEIQRDWITFTDQGFLAMESEFTEYEVDLSARPSSPTPAGAAEAYTGTYANDYFGPLTVSSEGESLAFSIGPEPKTFSLTHWNGDTFLFQPTGENSGGPGTVIFERTEDEPSSSVTIPYLNGDGMGTFIRE